MTEHTKSIRVLLVDDETDFLDSTAKALKRRGISVTTATNGFEALKVAKQEPFDVGVLDVKMPLMDGHRLYYALRVEVPEMQFIILTGHGDMQKAFQLGKKGLSTYLAKPVEIDELVLAIQHAYAAATKPPSVESTSRDASEPIPIRVLLVDDEAAFLASAASVLTRRGIDVFTAQSGQEALDFMDEQRVDVAVVDVKMPGIGGIDLLGRMKQAHPEIEVVLLTGHGNVSLAVSSMKKGAFDYLTKPQDMDEFVRIIRAACKKKRSTESSQRDAALKEIIDKNPS